MCFVVGGIAVVDLLPLARSAISCPHVDTAAKRRGSHLFHLDFPRKSPQQYNIHVVSYLGTIFAALQRVIHCLLLIFYNGNVITSQPPQYNTTPHRQWRRCTTGQGGGGSSGRGRHSFDRSAGRQGRQGLQDLGSGSGGPATHNDNGFGDADHWAPGCISGRPPTKGCQGAGAGRLASGVHPVATEPGRAFAGAAATVSDGSCGEDGRSWTADPGTGVAGDL